MASVSVLIAPGGPHQVTRATSTGTPATVTATTVAGAVSVPLPSVSTGGTITHGIDVNATNTGLNFNGVSVGSLTTTGGTTYSTNGQTIEGKRFTGTVEISGNNITLKDCWFDFAGGSSTIPLRITGDSNVVEGCKILPTSGSFYIGIYIEDDADGNTVRGCDISLCENLMTTQGHDAVIEESYLHTTSTASNPGGHNDVIEVYNGSATIDRCHLTMHADETAVINIAPWSSGSHAVDYTNIYDCYLDGGNAHVLADLQAGTYLRRTRVLRNLMGGHTGTALGDYAALLNSDGRTVVETEAALTANVNAILWPTTGDDVNYWTDCSDLSPDLTDQIVEP